MTTETIDKLFLELSQITQAKTAREMALESALMEANGILRSTSEIAKREGKATHWEGFKVGLQAALEKQHALLYPRK